MALYKIVKKEQDITERTYQISAKSAKSAREAMEKLVERPLSDDVTPILVTRYDKIEYTIHCEL